MIDIPFVRYIGTQLFKQIITQFPPKNNMHYSKFANIHSKLDRCEPSACYAKKIRDRRTIAVDSDSEDEVEAAMCKYGSDYNGDDDSDYEEETDEEEEELDEEETDETDGESDEEYETEDETDEETDEESDEESDEDYETETDEEDEETDEDLDDSELADLIADNLEFDRKVMVNMITTVLDDLLGSSKLKPGSNSADIRDRRTEIISRSASLSIQEFAEDYLALIADSVVNDENFYFNSHCIFSYLEEEGYIPEEESDEEEDYEEESDEEESDEEEDYEEESDEEESDEEESDDEDLCEILDGCNGCVIKMEVIDLTDDEDSDEGEDSDDEDDEDYDSDDDLCEILDGCNGCVVKMEVIDLTDDDEDSDEESDEDCADYEESDEEDDELELLASNNCDNDTRTTNCNNTTYNITVGGDMNIGDVTNCNNGARRRRVGNVVKFREEESDDESAASSSDPNLFNGALEHEAFDERGELGNVIVYGLGLGSILVMATALIKSIGISNLIAEQNGSE